MKMSSFRNKSNRPLNSSANKMKVGKINKFKRKSYIPKKNLPRLSNNFKSSSMGLDDNGYSFKFSYEKDESALLKGMPLDPSLQENDSKWNLI